MAEYTTLYTSEQISAKVKELAAKIASDYKDKQVLLVCVLKGAYIFTADLQRELHKLGLDTDVDFISVSSYGTGKEYSGETKILHDLTKDIAGLYVLIVEDIIDTGHTLFFLNQNLSQRNPASLKIAAFLDKKERREAQIEPDYVGFTLSGKPWVQGYGLDGGVTDRGRPDIITKTS